MGTLSILWLSAEDPNFVRSHVDSMSLYGPLGLFNITEGVEGYPEMNEDAGAQIDSVR